MKISKRVLIGAAALLAVVFVAGLMTGRRARGSARQEPMEESQAAVKFWTCSMHPQIHQPGPGQCPICGMDLIPVTEEPEGQPLGEREIRLTPAAQKLASVEVLPVERRFAEREVRMVGKVDYDETRLAYITAWVPGRLDRLYVDYTGLPVKKGDHMISLYSPDLLSAQEELLQAIQTARDLQKSDISLIRDRAQQTVTAARDKLKLWGLTEDQVAEIERKGTPSDHLTIYSPISGVVIHKDALEGMYVQTGTKVYTIADLSRVWVKLDAYESDLPWLRYGQQVEFEAEAYPGHVFRGVISFIDPILNAKTRTVKVRVNVANPDGMLKPDMFVRAVVRSRMGRGGQVFAPDLAGKWISPMHPEIVKDRPGTCDVCGMPLVSAESLGYAAGEPKEAPLLIPASAPLITGERAVVYVQSPGKPGVYEGREIALGPRADDVYLVRDGLREGELVVVSGNFKIDSAIQIQAKPSMMAPEGGPPPGHAHHGEMTGDAMTGGAQPAMPEMSGMADDHQGHAGHAEHPAAD